MKSSTPSYLLPFVLRRALLWTSHLGVGKPVVPPRVWILLVELPELLQATYQKVVEWFFRPVLVLWIVEPFDEV